MSKIEKLLFDIMCGYKDKNIKFEDLRKILKVFGFDCRIRGGHYIYTKTDIDEIINIQPIGDLAKPYQVKQVRNIFIKYQLGGNQDVEI